MRFHTNTRLTIVLITLCGSSVLLFTRFKRIHDRDVDTESQNISRSKVVLLTSIVVPERRKCVNIAIKLSVHKSTPYNLNTYTSLIRISDCLHLSTL